MENIDMPANADAQRAATRRSSRSGLVKQGLHHLEGDFEFASLKKKKCGTRATRTPRKKDLLLEGIPLPSRKSFALRSTKKVETTTTLQCAVPVNYVSISLGPLTFRTTASPRPGGTLDAAVVGLSELVQTNVTFSVTSYGRDIARLVFPFSKQLALGNSFGGIYQRQSAFYWRSFLEYDAKLRPAGYLTDPRLPSDYRDFGPSDETCSGETLSERILLNLREQSHQTVQGMWVTRKIDGKMVKTGWQLKTNEQHNFEQAELRRIVRQSSAGSKEFAIRNCKRNLVMNITKPNLAAERRRYDTKTVVVTARGQTGLACVRGLFNGTIGTGRNEPWISTKSIDDRHMNPYNVKKTSILTFAEVQSMEELETASDVQTDLDLDDENEGRPRKRRKRKLNGLTMHFDPVQRRSCISIRGTTLPVGSAASEYKNYLHKFGVDPNIFAGAQPDERDVYKHPKLGCKVFGDEGWTGGDDVLWEVIDVDNTSDMATLRQGDETRQVSLRYVEENDINN
ncbi:hypothetical protein THAOC_33574 [Thalassiosira oceanica]|uniref:Uncharacterized protein n=1 Tax=Thalassiosira oceanica TaxID=159749 RepID=K0RFL6_THAOC|nr:hypothetical protein THAOC_33574 [Thalassiosira oceanica]|eukprot:EJK47691.1 hypothetical protein THAOC_33574 [Thalassiosira oceanica]